MNGQYYYLVTGLPKISLDDNKLSYTVADFKKEFYPFLTKDDQKLIDFFYLKYDNANLLKLLADRDAELDARGNFDRESFLEVFKQLDEEGTVLSAGKLPAYLVDFIKIFFELKKEERKPEVLLDDLLSGLYYKYATSAKNKFIASWFDFNLTARNVMVAETLRKYKMKSTYYIVGDSSVSDALRTSSARDFGLTDDVEEIEQLIKLAEIEDLVEREKKFDLLQWNWMEDHTFFDYFSIERLFVFLLQIDKIERWQTLDKDKGNKKFREIIASLRNEVKVPQDI